MRILGKFLSPLSKDCSSLGRISGLEGVMADEDYLHVLGAKSF